MTRPSGRPQRSGRVDRSTTTEVNEQSRYQTSQVSLGSPLLRSIRAMQARMDFPQSQADLTISQKSRSAHLRDPAARHDDVHVPGPRRDARARGRKGEPGMSILPQAEAKVQQGAPGMRAVRADEPPLRLLGHHRASHI